MEPPYLKLVILQGPREGEALGFRPDKSVRIGRILRNNTFSIKDAGISSNHLSIQIESGKWVIRDLDSSNGTILNGSKIPPNTPFDLHHGDTIKIGEYTSIQVDLQAYEDSCLRRNPRRGATGKVGGGYREKLEEEEKNEKFEGENLEAGVVEPVEKKRRGRKRIGRVLKSEVGEELSTVQLQSIDENVEVGDKLTNVVPLQEKVEPLANRRITRNSKKQQQQQSVTGTSNSTLVNNSLDNSGLKCREEKIVEKKTRVGTRGRKLQEESSLCDQVAISEDVVKETRDSEADLNPGVKESFDKDECRRNSVSVKETCSKRKGEEGWSAQKKNINENVKVGDELTNVVPLQEKVEPSANRRVTRNSKNQQQQSVIGTSNSTLVNDSLDNSGLKCREEKIVEKETRIGTRTRKLQEETSLCDQVAISEDAVKETRDNEAGVNLGVTEDFDKDGSRRNSVIAKETCSKREGEEACSAQKNLNENGDWPDLEKLTLGEWFDFLEVHFPKQIIDATEEMIDSMKEKAERVRDYMVKQKNDKVKLPMG